MNDQQIAVLKAAALAATPQNIDTAESVERHEGGYIECPVCGGEGHVELEADFCNYDGKALGVQFYGIGPEHGAAEAYFRAARPASVLSLIERLERAEISAPSASIADTAGAKPRTLNFAHYEAFDAAGRKVQKEIDAFKAAIGESVAATPASSVADEQQRADWIDQNVSGNPALIQAMKNIAGASSVADAAGAKPFAYYTDWPGYRAYADEPHGWDEPGLILTDPESIRDVWHPLVEPSATTAPSVADATGASERARFEAWLTETDDYVVDAQWEAWQAAIAKESGND